MWSGQLIVAVGAVIEDRGRRLLLVKHRPERGGFWSGKWICPGGRLHLGETIAEGILREVREETDLSVELLEPLAPFDRIVKDDGGVSLHVIYIDYRARLAGGELRPGDDVGEALWMDRAELARRWGELHEDTQRLMNIAGVVMP